MGDTDGSSMAAHSARPGAYEQGGDGFFRRLFRAFKPAPDQVAPVDNTPVPQAMTPPPGLMNLRRMRVEDVAIPKADIVAEHGMELLASAQLTGQLYTSRLSVVDGAMFEGHVVVGPNAMQAASDVMQGVEDIQVDTNHEQFTPANGSKPDINTVPRSLDEILARRRSKTNGQAVPQHVGAGAAEETDE